MCKRYYKISHYFAAKILYWLMMQVFRSFLIMVCLGGPLLLTAQADNGDWDTYVLYIKNKPISIMVDLGFAGTPAAKQHPNVVIVSVQLAKIQQDGMPLLAEVKKLDTLEAALVDSLQNNLSAIYTGRYTSNGKRDYYFYSNDTLNAAGHVSKALYAYPRYQFKVTVKADAELSNYLNVLYPTQTELQRIYNRRMISQLVKAGDQLTAPRKVSHFLFFKTEIDRKTFALTVQDNRFTVDNFSEEHGVKDGRFSLEISRVDKVDEDNIDEVSLYLWELALKYGAKYDGWETFPVTAP